MPTRLVQIPNAPQGPGIPGLPKGTGASQIPNFKAPQPTDARKALGDIKDLSGQIGAAYARQARTKQATLVNAEAMTAPQRAAGRVGYSLSDAGSALTQLGNEILDAHNTAVRIEYETTLGTEFAKYQASLVGREDFEDWATNWEQQSEGIYKAFADRTKGGRGLDNLSLVRMRAEGGQQASLIKTAANESFGRAREAIYNRAMGRAKVRDFNGAAAIWNSEEARKYYHGDEIEANLDYAQFQAQEQEFSFALATDPAGVVDSLEKNPDMYPDQAIKMEQANRAKIQRGGQKYGEISMLIDSGLSEEAFKMQMELPENQRYLSDGQKAALQARFEKNQPDSSEDFVMIWDKIDAGKSMQFASPFEHDKYFQELKEEMDLLMREGNREVLHSRWQQARKESDPVEQKKARDNESTALAKARKKSVASFGTQTFGKLSESIFGKVDKNDTEAVLAQAGQTQQFYMAWTQWAEEHKNLDPADPKDMKVIRDSFFRTIKEVTGKDLNVGDKAKGEGMFGRFWNNWEEAKRKSREAWSEPSIEDRVKSAADRLKLSQANTRTVTPTFYSIGRNVGGTDETQDKWTNRGYTRTGENLSWGAVAVGSPAQIGTVFKDMSSGDVFIATDYHGNPNRQVFDYYMPPNDYRAAVRKTAPRNIAVIDKLSETELKKTGGTIEGFQRLRARYGAVRFDPFGPFHQRGRSLATLLTREQFEQT